MAQIFISHSSKDLAQAQTLLVWLHGKGFVSTFLDFDRHVGISVGADWEQTLYRKLSSADAVILILTSNWFDSKWCFVEFAQARALGKRIFPLIEPPTHFERVSVDIQHLDLTKNREAALEALQVDLTQVALDARGGYVWDSSRPPFPGMLAFDERDAPVYFGRDDDVRRLIERMNARRAQGGEKLLVVLGASGSGKSSLLRAGVIPRLKRDPNNWLVLPVFRPLRDPLAELAQVLATGLGKPAAWRECREALEVGEGSCALPDLIRDIRAVHGRNEAQILLVIDQGEELFADSNPSHAENFFAALNVLLDDRWPFLAAMSLRSDYLGRLQQQRQMVKPFEQFSLKSMPLERIREIIEGPAKVAGVLVDNALISAAINDAGTNDALPLLAFVMRELYDGAASTGRLTVESYRALGDPHSQLSPLENAVRRKADEVLRAAKPTQKELQELKETFIPSMVRVNAEGEYVRRSAVLKALPAGAFALVERLAMARLLTIYDVRQETVVEVTHEALLRKWPLLRGWLDQEREFLIGKEQLERDLHDWILASPEQKIDALLVGLKLTKARHWLLTNPQHLAEPERIFIHESVAHYQAATTIRERTRQRILYGSITSAVALILVGGAGILEWQRAKIHEREAITQEQIALATSVSALLADEESGLRGYQTTGDPRFLEPYKRALAQFPSKFDRLRSSNSNPHVLSAVKDLETVQKAWEAGFAQPLIAVVHAGGDTRDLDLNLQGKIDMDKMRKEIKAIIDEELQPQNSSLM